jgi:two-component system sensor histidine kinase KdpD
LVAESERLGRALLNSISHELRTPLAAITAAYENLSKPSFDEDPSSRRMLLAEIGEATQRLNRLVGNLLDITRLESGHIQPKLDWCDIVDLINSAVKGTAEVLSKHVLTVKIPDKFPLLKIDFGLIEQALKNILVNAASYTPPGTKVEIAARIRETFAEIEVSDNGPGIPQEAVNRVFEKFYRGPGTPVGGTGLGLSIVKGFVEAHEGTVSATNKPSGGAVFTIKLPLHSPPPLPPE